MPRIRWLPVTAASLTAASIALVASCTNERIVYRNTNVPTPPSNAGQFIGYFDASTHQTVCGNCHVDQQGRWTSTAHAHAWNTLSSSGQMQGFCQPCHTVNDRGNFVTDTAVGYRSTHDARYQDVQCEACHGPGLTHATAPSIQNRPLAPLEVGLDLSTGCGECHNGTHHPFVEEWAQSAHATMPQWKSRAAPQTRTACQSCHTGQGALVAWGVNTNFIEAGFAHGDTLSITCGVCHDPHGSANPKQLRFPIDVPDVRQNLCMKCHQRGSSLEPDTRTHGPHSPEGPLLLGTAGWWPPNLQVPGGVDTILGTHGSTANPGMCATCHVSRFAVNDSTGNLVFQVTGHLFQAIPCLDANGKPTTSRDCAITQRSFQACTASGCHGSETVARSAMLTAVGRIARLDTALRNQIAQVSASRPAELTDTTRFTTAQGALFNAELAERTGSAIHNPFLVEALLTASIQQMTKDYGVPSPDRVPLQNLLPKHLAPAPMGAPGGR